MKRVYFDSINELKEHILKKRPSLYLGSQTSTVIPFENLPPQILEMDLCYLEKLPQKMELLENGDLKVTGPVSWEQARAYLRSQGRDLLTTPTEELAGIIAGIATSATGERCFGYGTLRDQIVSLKYIDYKAQEIHLNSQDKFKMNDSSLLSEYQQACDKYQGFKNPPFPRFSKATDLLTGTEGQLGVITEVTIRTQASYNGVFLMIPLSKWTLDRKVHLDIFNKVQSLRDELISVEFLDFNCIEYLDSDDNIPEGFDYIVLEMDEMNLEAVYGKLILELDAIDEEAVKELSPARFTQIRSKIPRNINETNARAGIKKLGTDAQALRDEFKYLLNEYERFSKLGVKYCLFGHFGDGHLHFNFMPEQAQRDQVQQELRDFYKRLSLREISPFAEHGIGHIKKDFIRDFYSETQFLMFEALKSLHDPYNQFYTHGFMSMNR